jgi:hypothetical protein
VHPRRRTGSRGSTNCVFLTIAARSPSYREIEVCATTVRRSSASTPCFVRSRVQPVTRGRPKSGSQRTRPWREMDSNPRSPVKHQLEVVLRALDQAHGWIEPR